MTPIFGYRLYLLLFLVSSILLDPSNSFLTRDHPTILFQRHVTTRSSPLAVAEPKRNTEPTKQRKQKQKKNKRTGTTKRSPKGNKGANKQFQAAIQTNKRIVNCQSAKQVLDLLASTKGALTQTAGGGVLTQINFSTSIHRIARHLVRSSQADRAAVLCDPRFALFLCSLVEAMENNNNFQSRELSNVAWAITKLKITPSNQVFPHNHQETTTMLLQTAQDIRAQVYKAAQIKRQTADYERTWIPHLSKLSALLMDRIAQRIRDCMEEPRMQEWANLLWAYATSGRADPDTFELISNQMVNVSLDQESQQSQEWSNSIWAFATAQVYGPAQERLVEHVATLMNNPGFLELFKPQELSNTAWGVATLLSKKEASIGPQEGGAALGIMRHVARSVLSRDLDDFKTQELSNTAWAFATLGFGGRISHSLNDYVVLPTDDPMGDKDLLSSVLTAISANAIPRLDRFRSQELNNLAWSLARLTDGNDPEYHAVLEGIALELCNFQRRATSQDIGTTLWSLASLEFFDERIYRRIAARFIQERHESCKPQELSNTLWAMATADVSLLHDSVFDTSFGLAQPRSAYEDDPVTVCFANAAQELMRRPQEFKSQEIKDVLWSFSKVGVRHPNLFRAASEHLIGLETDEVPDGHIYPPEYRGLDEFAPQGLGNMAWAFARQGQLAEEVNRRPDGPMAQVSGRLSVYTSSYTDVGEVGMKRLFAAIADACIRVHDNLSALMPQDMANTAWAFAVLGLKHEAFLQAAAMQLEKRTKKALQQKDPAMMQLFKGQEIANLLWALASLNFPAGFVVEPTIANYICSLCRNEDGVVDAVVTARTFKRQELANIAWACAVFGAFPQNLMQLLYRSLVGTRRDDAVKLCAVYGDGGLQKQAMMSLLYLQTIMDLEGASSGLALPADFPEGWVAGSSPGDDNYGSDSMLFELSLSTSKIQRSVSDALKRIGFEHIEEFAISMDDLAREFQIQLSAKPIDLLSIDIVSSNSRLGIEVDGPSHFVSRIGESNVKNAAAGGGGYSKLVNGRMEYQFAWSDQEQEVNGATALKQRLLKRLGWRIYNLPFWDWSELQGDPIAEEDYCRACVVRLQQEGT